MGTPAFAVPSLERLVDAGHEVIAVYTQPDRPKGRGQKESMPPVKEAALRLNLPVHQPLKVRQPEVVAEIAAMAPGGAEGPWPGLWGLRASAISGEAARDLRRPS